MARETRGINMTARLQLRRGTTAEMDAFTGAEGEPTFDVDKGTVVVHDGVTLGGIPLARSDSQELDITTDDVPEGSANLYWIEAPLDDEQYVRKNGGWVIGDFTSYDSADFTADFNTKTTDDLSEGASNLYFTDSRARSAFTFTDDISFSSSTGEVSVITYKSANFDSDFSSKTTDDLSEGTSNLYFIEAPEDGGQYVRQDGSWVEVDLSGADVDLGTTVNSNNVVITNTAGTDATIPAADENNAGVMTAFSQTFDGIKTFQDEIRCESDIVAFYSSDARLKENITDLNGALSSLEKIRGVEYDWTDEYLASKGGEDGAFARKHDVGVIAQELQEVLPEAVLERSDGYMGVRYEKIVPLLLQAIKELKLEVDQLKQEK